MLGFWETGRHVGPLPKFIERMEDKHVHFNTILCFLSASETSIDPSRSKSFTRALPFLFPLKPSRHESLDHRKHLLADPLFSWLQRLEFLDVTWFDADVVVL